MAQYSQRASVAFHTQVREVTRFSDYAKWLCYTVYGKSPGWLSVINKRHLWFCEKCFIGKRTEKPANVFLKLTSSETAIRSSPSGHAYPMLPHYSESTPLEDTLTCSYDEERGKKHCKTADKHSFYCMMIRPLHRSSNWIKYRSLHLILALFEVQQTAYLTTADMAASMSQFAANDLNAVIIAMGLKIPWLFSYSSLSDWFLYACPRWGSHRG